MDKQAPAPARIILGWYLDGAPAPCGLPALTALAGPAGFVDLLAAWLGLGLRQAPEPVRIAACQAALGRIGPGFWSASLAAEPWSTAAAVLALRDDLCAAGWDGQPAAGLPPRLADLARLPHLPPGPPDLLAAAIAALRAGMGGGLPAISLAEPAALWPPDWRALFAALADAGAAPLALPEPPIPPGDLGALAAALDGGGAAEWQGDGSLVLLAAEDAATAADQLAAWLGVAGAGAAVIRPGTELAAILLDMALQGRHLPRLGGAGGAGLGVQLLGLALACRWEPFDAAAALEFVSLSSQPLGPEAGRRLGAAIAESPGHSGAAWREALRHLLRATWRRHRDSGRTKRRQALRQICAEIDFWLPARRATRAEGLPASELLEICARLGAWAAARQDPALAGPATALAAAITALDAPTLSPAQLGRMLGSVAAAASSALPAEAAPWRIHTNPGSRVDPVATSLWWLDSAEAARTSPWRAAERDWLAASGLHPDDTAARRGRERAAWRRALLLTGRLILVRPAAIGGEVVATHPLLASLHACFGQTLAWESAAPGMALAGAVLPASIVPPAQPPGPLRLWRVPAGQIGGRAEESASGMETLLGCHLAWVLRYPARLRARGPAILPEAERLTGLLLHAVLRRLFAARRVPPPDQGRQRARDLFQLLLPQEAAPLQQPGQEVRQAQALRLLESAIERLLTQIDAAGLDVAAVEQEKRRDLPDHLGAMAGRLDLLLRRPSDGLLVVLDAKWTGSARRHRDKLAAGEAVQLAAYAWLAAPAGEKVSAAYMLLRQGMLHAASPDPFAAAAVPGADLAATWRAALAGYRAGLAVLGDGQVVASGVPAAEGDDEAALPAGALVLPPPCRWCDYRGLCGAPA